MEGAGPISTTTQNTSFSNRGAHAALSSGGSQTTAGGRLPDACHIPRSGSALNVRLGADENGDERGHGEEPRHNGHDADPPQSRVQFIGPLGQDSKRLLQPPYAAVLYGYLRGRRFPQHGFHCGQESGKLLEKEAEERIHRRGPIS